MKKLFLLILLPIVIFAQETPLHTGELIINLINKGTSWNVTFTLTAISARWDENNNLTEDYETASVNINSTPPLIKSVAYFDHIWTSTAGDNPIFAAGLYKISAIESGVEKAYFYMDWRTSTAGWIESVDVYFKYDYANKHFRNAANTQIIDYSYQTLWDLTSNLLITSGLEDYWNNCLAVFNNGDDHPKFAWGPKPDFTNSYYKIYKKKGTPDFVLYDSTTSNTYLDVNQYILTGLPNANEGSAYYKITSVGYLTEVYSESGFSNTVDIRVKLPAFEKQGSEIISGINNYSLSQNYPNPFNPATTIMFSLPVSAQVTLKVYDVLGREAASLIDSYKEAGSHSIKFDASNLTSGIYFYQLKAGEYIETKKLILQK